jgi:hypothetical protein
MAYNYLLELYQTIAERQRDARAAADGPEADREYHRGRLEALDALDRFLKDNYHGRLPRRIRTRIDGASPPADAEPAS